MNRRRIAELGERVLDGGEIGLEDSEWMLELEGADIFDLLAWANRIRETYKGNRVHLCSIINAKSNACPEDCAFCSQSARYQTDAPTYGFVQPEDVAAAADSAASNGAQALGIVAAWRGLKEGKLLDEVCQRISELSQNGRVRADASLGIIPTAQIAQRLKDAGLACYNHNLETARSFFKNICTTHTHDDRVQTIGYLKEAGIKVCCGGIMGMGESLRQRVELAFELGAVDPDVVPINFLNPIAGTPLGQREPVAPLEALKTIAMFRFVLPTQEILVAGGREVTLRSLQPLMFAAGASATMVGNYLTTLGNSAEDDLKMIRDLGLSYPGEGAFRETAQDASGVAQPGGEDSRPVPDHEFPHA